jgi:drug/metabolite transporter (DMT)-like permease
MIMHRPQHLELHGPTVTVPSSDSYNDNSEEKAEVQLHASCSSVEGIQLRHQHKKFLNQQRQRATNNCYNCIFGSGHTLPPTSNTMLSSYIAIIFVSLYILSSSTTTTMPAFMVMGYATRPVSFIPSTLRTGIHQHLHHGSFNILEQIRTGSSKVHRRNVQLWSKQPIRKSSSSSSSPQKKSSQSALSHSSALIKDSQRNATTTTSESYSKFVDNEMYYYSFLLSTLEDTYEKSDSMSAVLDTTTEPVSPWLTDSLTNSPTFQKEESEFLSSENFQESTSLSTGSAASESTTLPAAPIPSSNGNFMRFNDVAIARILLIGAAALYGTNFSLVKMLGNMDIPIGISATLRFGLAAIATSPWLFLKNNHKKDIKQHANGIEPTTDNAILQELPKTGGKIQEFLSSKGLWSYELGATLVGLEAGVWNSMAYITQAVGLTTTAASKSAFLCSLAVVIVPLLDRLSGKKLEMKQILGVLLALGGVAVLELGGLSAEQLQFTTGDIASLMQPLAFGMAFWRMEYACHNYPDEATRLTASQLLAVFTCSTLFTLFSDPASFQYDSIVHWLSNPMIITSLAWTGLVSTALTVYMETIALKSVSAAETTLILSTEPLWGSFFAAILMGETFGFDAVIGGVLILSGCLYSSLGYNGIKTYIDKIALKPSK